MRRQLFRLRPGVDMQLIGDGILKKLNLFAVVYRNANSATCASAEPLGGEMVVTTEGNIADHREIDVAPVC